MKIFYRAVAAALVLVLRVALVLGGKRIGESTRAEIVETLAAYRAKNG